MVGNTDGRRLVAATLPLTGPVFPDLGSGHDRDVCLVEALADVWTVVPSPTVGRPTVTGLRLP